MTNLVFLEPNRIDSIPFTTSDVIAEYANVSYRSIQKIIETHEKRLSKFGRVRFEITPFATRGGVQDKKIYHLTEEQATLLITFLKNTEIVADFKTELVRQFYAMRTELLKCNVYRSEGKSIRRELTDVIQEATDDKWAYKHFTDLAYKTVTGKSASQLRKERGADKKAVTMDYMTADEMNQINKVTYQIVVLVEMGMDYKQVKTMLANRQLVGKTA